VIYCKDIAEIQRA